MSNKNVNTVTLQFDPIVITRQLIQLYIEKHIEGKTTLSRQYALYDYLLIEMTDDDYRQLIKQYATKFDLQSITFEDWQTDCKRMIEIIEESDRFQELMRKFKNN